MPLSQTAAFKPLVLFQKLSTAQIFFLIVLLLSTLSTGKFLGAARVAWTLQAMLLMLYPRLAFYALSFYAAFFHHAGFLANFYFTIKHFHIAAALTFLVQLFKRESLMPVFNEFFRKLRFYLPVFMVLCIGIISGFAHGPAPEVYRIPLNLMLVLLIMGSVSAVLAVKIREFGETLILEGIIFHLIGAVLHIGIAFYNLFAGTDLLDLSIFHNNHLGFLCALSLPLALSVFWTSHGRFLRLFSFLVTAILICGLVASCSRTAWFSFAGGLFFFLLLGGRSRSRLESGGNLRRKEVISLSALLLVIMTGLAFAYPGVYARFYEVTMLLDPDYWRHTLQDKQNFGCFGIFRLRDLLAVKGILSENNLVTGIGMRREVVDFHGLYILFLGSSGVFGVTFFLWFLFRTAQRLYWSALEPQTGYLRPVAIGLIASLMVWALSSIMESFFLQFTVWLHTALAAVLLDRVKELKVRGHTYKKQPPVCK